MPRPSTSQRDDATKPEKPAKKATASEPAAVEKPRKRSKKDPEIRLTGDRLVVRSTENGERKSSGGLLIPATAAPAPKRLHWGEVRLAGPEVRVAKIGDRVLYLPSSGLEVELGDEELILLRERDVQAVAPSDEKADRTPGQYL